MSALFDWPIRLGRAARRFIATGKLRATPAPIIDGFFGGKACLFVQVGSNDGVSGDPLRGLIKANPLWRGIFIEPLEEPMARLLSLYGGDSRFTFEQIAISDTAQDRWLYCVSQDAIRETGMPTAIDAISSFSRAHVLKNLTNMRSLPEYKFANEPDQYIAARQVRCEPLMSVLDRLGVGGIDVLAIDAETYDYEILKQLDFDRFRPKLVLYEHNSLTESDRKSASLLLTARGYQLVGGGSNDTLAVRTV